MKIVVKANGGLGNRMRVLSSCIALGHIVRAEVEVLWVNNQELNCDFNQLFLPVIGLSVTQKKVIPSWNKIALRLRKAYFDSFAREFDLRIGDEQIREIRKQDLDFVEQLNGAKSVYIDTCEHFYGDLSFLAHLVPQADILHEVERRFIRMNTKQYVGVHIRRGDHLKAKQNSPTALFMKLLNEELKKDAECQFYLSTDDTGESKIMRKRLGDKIHHFTSGLKRDKPQDIKNALVDMLMLSKSKKIIGSYWSSFSDIASSYGGVPLHTAKVE